MALKDCPHCGSTDVTLTRLFRWAYVSCETCHAQTEWLSMRHKHNGKWATDVAVKKWNASESKPLEI